MGGYELKFKEGKWFPFNHNIFLMPSSIVCPSPLANVLVDLLVLWPHVAEHSPAQTIPVASAHEIGCSKHTLNIRSALSQPARSCRKGLIFPTFFFNEPFNSLTCHFHEQLGWPEPDDHWVI